MRITFAVLALLLFIPWVALAAPRLESLAVKAESGKPNEVVISVSIERPTPMDLKCDAMVEPGDGGKLPLSWGVGDRRTKTARHEYKKSGSYRVRVAGSGKDACVGVKEVTVEIGSSPGMEPRAISERCPSGWMLLENSVRGARFTCRAKPPAQALRCANGTSYFSERGEIGCR
jgi:hypothetical protein